MRGYFRGGFRNYGDRNEEETKPKEENTDDFIKIPKDMSIEEQVAYLLEK